MRALLLHQFVPVFSALLFLSSCASAPKQIHAPVAPVTKVHSPEFRQAMGAVLGPPFIGGNRVVTLVNGDQIFPAMLRAIRSATKTITFETYIYDKGRVPRLFTEALAERARAGVKVHMILDGHGAKMPQSHRQMLEEAGAEVVTYSPALLSLNLFRYNNRTHRKLLVVDGKIGFIGGVGIADEWSGNGDSPEHWHDLHYQVEGPVVAEMQAAFLDSWLKMKRNLLHGAAYFPPLPARGNLLGSVFYSSPEHGSHNVEIMMNLAVSSARQSLLIANSYFVPDADLTNALIAAAQRGVRVQIIVPGQYTDSKAVRRASQARWGPLLDAGIEIYEYQPTMLHSKLLIADGLFVSVGSANLDYRSLRINAEANLNILDAGFAAEQRRIFEAELKKSRRISREEQRRRVLKNAPVHVLEAPLAPLL